MRALLTLAMCLLSACVGLSVATDEGRYLMAHDRLLDAMEERDIGLEQRMRRLMAELLTTICPADPGFYGCPKPAPPPAAPAGLSSAVGVP